MKQYVVLGTFSGPEGNRISPLSRVFVWCSVCCTDIKELRHRAVPPKKI